MDVEGGLGVERTGQHFHRAIEGDITDGVAQLLIRLGEDMADELVLFPDIVPHTDLLGALAGE